MVNVAVAPESTTSSPAPSMPPFVHVSASVTWTSALPVNVPPETVSVAIEDGLSAAVPSEPGLMLRLPPDCSSVPSSSRRAATAEPVTWMSALSSAQATSLVVGTASPDQFAASLQLDPSPPPSQVTVQAGSEETLLADRAADCFVSVFGLGRDGPTGCVVVDGCSADGCCATAARSTGAVAAEVASALPAALWAVTATRSVAPASSGAGV